MTPASWVLRAGPARLGAWQRGAPALLYHRIAPRGGEPSSNDPFLVDESELVIQLRWLRERFELVTMAELASRIAAGSSVHGMAAVTFDDGRACTVRHALPILEELGVPATVYVETGRLDQTADDLRSEDLARLAGSGVELGSHTVRHLDLTTLDDVAVAEELVASRRRIEELSGTAVTGFAHPFGRFDDRTVRAVREAGYTHACTCRQDHASSPAGSPYALPRIEINRCDDRRRFERKLGGHYSGVYAAWYRWEDLRARTRGAS